MQQLPSATLTIQHRSQSRQLAEATVRKRIGNEPKRSDFDNWTASRYPGWFSRWLTAGLLAVMVSAGFISGIRLAHAGWEQAQVDVDWPVFQALIAVLTPLAAEILVAVMGIARQTIITSKIGKRAAWIPILVGLAVAFVGNWSIIEPSTTWQWVETLYPPIAMLSVAFIFEASMRPALEQRAADQAAFEEARDAWQRYHDNPTAHPQFRAIYRRALWETWARVYPDYAELSQHNPGFMRAVADRELAAEEIFADEPQAAIQRNAGNAGQSKVGRDEVLDAIRDNPELMQRTQAEIAARTGAAQSTVSRALNSSEGKALAAALSRNGTGH